MEVLFCYLNEAGYSQEIDWKEEAEAAEECDFRCHSFSYDLFFAGDLEAALEQLPDGDGTELLYRGWLMPEDDYRGLDEALYDKTYRLVSGIHEYRETLLLPNYYDAVKDLMIPAAWTDEPDIEEAWELAREFGTGPWVIRDHMKSAKEAWLSACYIPEGADFSAFRSVCKELQDRREPHFTNGFVVRPYIPLKRLAVHWSGSPVSEEYRLIYWQGKRVITAPYYEIGSIEIPDLSMYDDLADRIDSRFFVADVAITEEGRPILIELNPGGCAGFPPQLHPIDFYQKLSGQALTW